MLKMKSNLINLMLKKDLSFLELQKQTNINRAFLKNLAKGTAIQCNINHLSKLIEFFGCEIKDLIDFEKEDKVG